MNPDLQLFLQAWTGGADVSDAESQRLLHRLETDGAFRAECVDEIHLLGMLKAVQTTTPRWLDLHDALSLSPDVAPDLASRVLRLVQAEPQARPFTRWFTWRPLTAAAAGIVLGMLCTSMVFGFVVPTAGKVMTLLQEGFESGPAPLVTGVPIEPGKWSGDFAEVVGEQQGVKPSKGKKMLRFLRADYEGKGRFEGNYFADVFRLIDVRPYQREFVDGGAVVQLSAAFNAFAFPTEEAFGGSVAVHALNVATDVDGSRLSEWSIESESLAMARNHRLNLDRDPGTWQRLGTELRLPPNTEFLLISISVNHSTPSQRRASFDGHFVDNVRLSMARRAPLP